MIASNPIGSAIHIHHPLDARKACGFSQSEMGRRLGLVHPNGHAGRPYTRGAVSQWENGIYPMNNDVREAYRRIIAGQISLHSNGMLWTHIHFGKRKWSVWVLAFCGECGRAYTPKTRKNRVCSRCR